MTLCSVCSDIKLSEIDESLWKMGMAYNHGQDKQGNHIGKELGGECRKGEGLYVTDNKCTCTSLDKSI